MVTKMISVVLASGMMVVREGMKRILLSHHDIEVVAEVKHPSELAATAQLPLEAVMVVAHLTSSSGQDALLSLQKLCPTLRVIVVTRTPTMQQILSALRLGVRGLLDASCAANHLPTAIRAVSSGRIYMHEDVSRIVANDLDEVGKDHSHRALTQRELEIFLKLASGKKVSEIAAELNISVKTVSTHKVRMMEKMGMTSFSQLVQYAIAHRLFEFLPRLA